MGSNLIISFKCVFFSGWNDCNAYIFNDFKKKNKNWLPFEFILDFL